MGELLIRRREMIQPSSTPVITPAYELASPTSTQNYDTGWIPFPTTPKDFTILCEAYCCNYYWNGSGNRAIFALTSGATFRMGYASGYNYYANGVKTGSSKTPYTALVFNQAASSGQNPQDTDVLKCSSLYPRDASSSTYTTKRVAVRFDCTTLKVEGFSARGQSSYRAPTDQWWNIEHYPDIYSTTAIKLCFALSSTCTVNVFRAYDCKLSDDQINDFLDGVT